MILQALLAEFEHEVNNTRKLLEHVPEKDINYKPSSISWTMGELAQHIATIYHWYAGTLTMAVYDLATDKLERGDPADIQATRELFEKNAALARTALQSIKEESLQEEWTMKSRRADSNWATWKEVLWCAVSSSIIFIITVAR